VITKLAKVGIYTRDQQRSLDFFTRTLGFEVRSDEPMGPGARWIEVAPPGGQSSLVLWTPPGMEGRIGTFSGMVFSCDDIRATFAELRGRGVQFTQEPTDQPGGVMATFADPDGNSYVLREGD
jgi:catechol 2,3-dioxygenase-like lactoylglutathione lyase family enzyme